MTFRISQPLPRGAGRLRDRGQSEDLPDRFVVGKSRGLGVWLRSYDALGFYAIGVLQGLLSCFSMRGLCGLPGGSGRIPVSRAAEILRIDKPERHGNMEHDAVMNFGMRPCLL